MTGKSRTLANKALTTPNKAPIPIAIINAKKALPVTFQTMAAIVAHINEAGPRDISNDPLE